MKKILLVDDHAVVRSGVKLAFDKHVEAVSFGEAGTGSEALKLVREQDWDIVVLDISLGGKNGLEVLKEIRVIRPRLPVLILSMHTDEDFARRALKTGASGYITKDSPRAELVTAIVKVMSGGTYISAAVADKLIFDIVAGSDSPPHETLSDREFEVMRLIASGKAVGQIAIALSLSDSTINTYRARILEKMGMKTNAELTYYAIKNKLVD